MPSQLVTMMISSIPGSLFLLKVSTKFENRIQVVIGTRSEAKGRQYIHPKREEWTNRKTLIFNSYKSPNNISIWGFLEAVSKPGRQRLRPIFRKNKEKIRS